MEAVLIIGFALLRIVTSNRAIGEKTSFVPTGSARATTPQTAVLSDDLVTS